MENSIIGIVIVVAIAGFVIWKSFFSGDSSESSASASAHIPYSSSYIASQHQSVYYDSHLFRSFVGGSVTRDDGVGTTEPFNGSTMTKNNSPDGEEPVETTVTTPTTLITKEPGDSKLLVK